ncbi:MAG: efflux RND transporter periplasmic adaptor subunit [Syntrophobacterales bacterium]|jgi:membrane fusion protein (multidrug efflux system)|nr:efflux RND transporter periplasmic adaptor subunit [Syntrophobacterales bacterium]
MNKPVLVLASLLAATITFFGPWQACGQEKGKEEAQKAKPIPMVAVQKAQVAPISRTLELTGTATPTRQARLASPGEGPIQNCWVREGAQVKRGERLVTIGRSGAAAAQVTAASESLKEQQAELNRMKILVQSGAVPGSQLDTARAKYEGARALLAKARESAGDYSVAAPWDGVVSKVLVKDGDFVAPRAPLVEMYDPNSLVIRLAIPEAQSTSLFKGMPVKVEMDAYPGKTFEGKISLVYPDLDTRMRTRTAEVELDYPVALIPGMFARLQVGLETATEAVVVPGDAVLVMPNGEKVAFILKDGKAQRRVVQTGLEAGGQVQVVSGIQPGETVVTAGNEKLKDGMEVKAQGGAGK